MRRSPLCPLAFLALAGLAWAPISAHAADAAPPSVEFGATLNGLYQSRAQALVDREKGLGLAHSDITANARLTPWLQGRFTGVAHSEENRVHTEVEEAYLEAPGLPGGLQIRAGRFLTQIGYLNERHPHQDDFVDRPLMHRAFLGGHYFDNGLRLNWVAPTPLYWRSGIEVLNGKRLPAAAASRSLGAYTLSTRIGGDLGASQSWLFGLSTLRHRGGASGEDPAHEGMADADADTLHRHGARFFGRRIDWVEAVWKWSPGGNLRGQQLRLSAEFARASGLSDESTPTDRHMAGYLSAVYRFTSQWEAGLRLDSLRGLVHDHALEAFTPARLQERSLSLAWMPSHASTLRLQWTGQRDRGGFAEAGSTLFLQYVVNIGAHGAHAF